MAVTEARSVLARGVEVTLADGQPRRLIFDLDALEVIEAEWGSLGDFAAALHRAVDRRFRANLVKVVRSGVHASLSHLQLPLAQLRLLVGFEEVNNPDVLAAVAEAWLEGVPMAGGLAREGKASAGGSASTGPRSTASASSDSAEPTTSGAG